MNLNVHVAPPPSPHPPQVLFGGADGHVEGVATNDFGIGRDGTPKPNFAPGVDLRTRVTLLAEGCRGSLSEVRL